MKNKLANYSLLIILIILLLPICIYLFKFHNSLSDNHQSWSEFGSYIGGVYGPIISILSIIILIVTLKQMRSSQDQDREHFQIQLNEQSKQRSIDDIIMLTNMVSVALGNNPIVMEIKQYPKQFLTYLEHDCRHYKPQSELDLWKLAFKRMKDDRYFDSEVHILGEILERIEGIDDKELKLRAKMIVKGLLPQGQRFLFKCYANAWHPKSSKLLEKWPDFCHQPNEFKTLLERYREKN